MTILLTGGSGYLQMISVLIVFVLVLGVTAFTTRWIANYQKKQNSGGNMELLETMHLGNNKYLQLVRIGDTYVALAVCKDTVTMLCQIPKEQLKELPEFKNGMSFKELFKTALKQKDVEDKPGE